MEKTIEQISRLMQRELKRTTSVRPLKGNGLAFYIKLRNDEVHACTCSSSCGSNYSQSGSCTCSSTCGSNYSH